MDSGIGRFSGKAAPQLGFMESGENCSRKPRVGRRGPDPAHCTTLQTALTSHTAVTEQKNTKVLPKGQQCGGDGALNLVLNAHWGDIESARHV